MPNISIKIDVTKVDKAKLYKGEKGTYLNCIMIHKETQFGDFMIVQEVTKEERLKGIKGPILGNGKIMEKTRTVGAAVPSAVDGKDDVPF